MRKKNYLHFKLIFLLICFGSQNLSAQEQEAIIYEAYINAEMDKWSVVVDQMEVKDSLCYDQKLKLISYYYGYTGFLVGMDRKKEARKYLARADKHVSALLKEYPTDATLLAYKGSFTGLKLALNLFKVMILGPESMRYIKKAYKTDPNNIQAMSDMAHLLYFVPKIIGGDKKEAVVLYEKTIATMERNNLTDKNWFYLNLLTMLARHYEQEKETEKSQQLFSKILRIEPNCRWVTDGLYKDFSALKENK